MAIDVDISGALAALDGLGEKVEQSVPGFLASVGERFCEEARATKTYSDRTGRLSASIGYGVFEGGTLAISGGFGGGEGETEGMDALKAAATELDGNGTALVVVAGMRYASYVERSGHAVLDGARLSADEIVRGLISELAL